MLHFFCAWKVRESLCRRWRWWFTHFLSLTESLRKNQEKKKKKKKICCRHVLKQPMWCNVAHSKLPVLEDVLRGKGSSPLIGVWPGWLDLVWLSPFTKFSCSISQHGRFDYSLENLCLPSLSRWFWWFDSPQWVLWALWPRIWSSILPPEKSLGWSLKSLAPRRVCFGMCVSCSRPSGFPRRPRACGY